MTLEQLSALHKTHSEKSLFGRYITNLHIEPLLEKLGSKFEVSTIGYSVKKRPVYAVKIGTGATKILVWSQMHGNESTTTKALFDIFNCIENSEEAFVDILNNCTIQIIPILNPDGAKAYTRFNANKVDLNRDAQNLSQPESVILRNAFDAFNPDFCLNLHGQRTIFGVGNSGNSAVLSFLTPAQDQNRSITESRKVSMSVIAKINKALAPELKNNIGRYDDDFNLNCVGDTFQTLNVPTILYEAGHYPKDYDREITRKYIFYSLYFGLVFIAKGVDIGDYETYLNISENEKNFYDVIIRDAKLKENSDAIFDVAIQFKENLNDNTVAFIPIIEKIEKKLPYFAHKEIKAASSLVTDANKNPLEVGNEIVFVTLNNHKILIKS